MAKYRAPKAKKSAVAQDMKTVLPCLFLVLSIFGLFMLLFYWVLKSST